MYNPLRVKLDIMLQSIISTGYMLVRNDYNSCDLIIKIMDGEQSIDDLSGYSATIVVSRADEVIINDFMIVTIGENASPETSFTLYSVDGHKVKAVRCVAGENNISTADLPRGLYIGVIGANEKIKTFKVIKK